ncbi:MAG: AbrB/MazE/SpoVT family DNA-binding domain-containing protein [Lachnospiraceae bacterium]|nr:AbrB/MazE/SpoVT family DNA-binding domain-containing protein [Lachnospiraceae bacterium]
MENTKKTGIVRELDRLGRITLPKEFRRSLQLKEKDKLMIFAEEDRIILTRYCEGDIFTGEQEDLIEFEGKFVSKKSIRELVRRAGLELKE